ncbi:nucleoside/nucleotide kinase family protein [Vreelandella janggokensis]|uniref:nucleoside/nucleotide kinase family protein n=1 Tax=Vreelandella janggokensis TaxID=370767 RepID=UPI002862E71B|nr:nucleoside/nucleotide kinase family protein [Halomonas janggokensis]MDR5884852.1 nucleoside/nucleotide kinase family protein [Halomonas janggokensis]
MTPDIDHISRQIIDAAAGIPRYIVALAGPPGAGKSYRSEQLCAAINQQLPGQAGVVPMDGYHFDNAVLGEAQLPLKGAPHTFDVDGLRVDLERLRRADQAVAVPVFDRPLDLARAGGRLIRLEQRIVIVEGNYLLLDRPIWRDLQPLFDWTLMLDVDDDILAQRLVARWLAMGQDHAGAIERTHQKDMLNAQLVKTGSFSPDQYWR